MPASLIIIAALTCFILWFRCFLLSIALGYDLQQQVLEVRRQPLIRQLWLVEAGTSCGLSLKGSSMSWAALPCLKPLGGKTPGVWNISCPILLQWPVLSTPSNFVPLLALSGVKSSQSKPSHSVYSLWKGFDFWSEWLVMQRQVQEQGECPTTGSLVHGGIQKNPSPALLQWPFLLSH